MNDLDDVIREFLVESHENLEQLERDLVVLEKDPQNRERLASIFRTIHTIKGTCGFFAFTKLEAVTHAGENLLSKLRDGELFLGPEITSALLSLVDAVRAMLTSVESTGGDGDGDYRDLIGELARLQEPSASPETATAAPVEAVPSCPGEPLASGSPASLPPPETEPTRPLGEVLVEKGSVQPELLQQALKQQAAGDPRYLGQILIDQGAARPSEVFDALVKQQEARTAAVSESTIRVDVGLLDRLMNLVGELVLARNQILQFCTTQKDTGFLSTSQRLNLITTELQEGVMKTRMQPIGNVWSRFPRIVRDLALTCGKRIRLEMEGENTELDKTIIEAIKDPLTHIVRNSVDHGIEKPEVRETLGKPAEGRLLLRAYHEGGQVNIEISDDGGGIDSERVKRKAVQRGLISRDQAERMSDREAFQLIFLPGFSTAETITNVSGRGVGMDVVKTNIEKIGGTVDIQSQPEKGTTLKIKIPLTLAIIPALIVTSGGDRFAIPQVSLLELVRLEEEQARRSIERIHGSPVYRLRGRLLPLVYLDRELGVEGRSSAGKDNAINIVVLQADDHQFGLVVEGINDTEEIVVKPLGKQLKGIPVFAGATIMGDGKVALILDVLGIAQKTGVVSEVRDRPLTDRIVTADEDCQSRQNLLLLGLGEERRLALPLSLVARLEEIPTHAVEKADGRDVVQYRGRILPLLCLSEILGGQRREPTSETLPVVVYVEDGHSVGLVVDRILDIVEASLDIQHGGRRPGVLGSTVIQQRVTDLLDVQGLLRSAELFPIKTAV